jgi:hypothetical protein
MLPLLWGEAGTPARRQQLRIVVAVVVQHSGASVAGGSPRYGVAVATSVRDACVM